MRAERFETQGGATTPPDTSTETGWLLRVMRIGDQAVIATELGAITMELHHGSRGPCLALRAPAGIHVVPPEAA